MNDPKIKLIHHLMFSSSLTRQIKYQETYLLFPGFYLIKGYIQQYNYWMSHLI